MRSGKPGTPSSLGTAATRLEGLAEPMVALTFCQMRKAAMAARRSLLADGPWSSTKVANTAAFSMLYRKPDALWAGSRPELRVGSLWARRTRRTRRSAPLLAAVPAARTPAQARRQLLTVAVLLLAVRAGVPQPAEPGKSI